MVETSQKRLKTGPRNEGRKAFHVHPYPIFFSTNIILNEKKNCFVMSEFRISKQYLENYFVCINTNFLKLNCQKLPY